MLVTSLLVLLFCLASPVIVYLLLGLGKPVTMGPHPLAFLPGMLFSTLRLTHGGAVLLVVSSGIGLTPARFNVLLDLVVGILAGWAIGTVMAKYRLSRAEYSQGGPDMSVPDEKLFPSDRTARLKNNVKAKPLPVWLDIAVLVGSEAIGVVAGFAWVAIGGG